MVAEKHITINEICTTRDDRMPTSIGCEKQMCGTKELLTFSIMIVISGPCFVVQHLVWFIVFAIISW